MNKIIKVEDVSFTYDDGKKAIDNISFEIDENSWTSIIGKNGSGKSTIVQLLDGILDADEGKIYIDNVELTDDTVWEIRKKIGIVFQNPDHQFVGATVEDDIAFGLENRQVPHDEMVDRVRDALSKVGMADFAKKDPQTLSGGQKQRVAIAGAIVLNPKILILDEATSMLDPNGRIEVIEIIKKLKKELELTIVSITHDTDEYEISDNIIVFKDGKILRQAAPSEIFEDKKLLEDGNIPEPFVEKFKNALISAGIDIKDVWLTEEELREEIWKYHSKM